MATKKFFDPDRFSEWADTHKGEALQWLLVIACGVIIFVNILRIFD